MSAHSGQADREGRVGGFTRRYMRLVQRVLRDALWRFRGTVISVTLLGLLGSACQIGAFLVAVLYATRLAEAQSVVLLGTEYDPRTSVPLLVYSGCAVCLLLILGGIVVYVAGLMTISAAQRYEAVCTERALAMMGRPIALGPEAGTQREANRLLMNLVKKDARLCARVLRIVLSGIIPALTAVAAFAVLMWINVFLTCLILVIVLCTMALHARISRAAAAHSREHERQSKAAGAVFRSVIDAGRLSALPPSRSREHAARAMNDPAVLAYLHSFAGRLHSLQHSRVGGRITTAVVMVMVMVVFGAAIMRGDQQWQMLLVYLIALRFAMLNGESTLVKLTSINRFHPQVNRYFQFVDDRPGRKPTAPPASGDGSAKVDLVPGSPIAVIAAYEPDRYRARELLDALMGEGAADHAARCAIVSHRAKLESVPPQPRDAYLAAMIDAVAHSDAPVVLLDDRAVRMLGADAHQHIGKLSNAIVLVISQPGRPASQWVRSLPVAVVSNGCVLATATAEEHALRREQLEQLIDPSRSGRVDPLDDEADNDDDDEL